jgi:heme oxygenase (biliverdin-producing, ferredoxin)
MNNLKELTKKHHTRAEKTAFVNRMLKKNMSPRQYYIYLSNLFLVYSLLEELAKNAGVLEGIEGVRRSTRMMKDLQELESQYGYKIPKPLKTTMDYYDYIMQMDGDKDRLLAHIYVHHMGDLSGGQILKRFVHGSATRYEFDDDIEELKNKIRAKLHDGLAQEAMVCFDMVTEFLEELEESVGHMGITN